MNKVKNKSDEEYYYWELPEEREDSPKIPLAVKTGLFIFLGMGFSCFKGPENISPFAVSFLSAVPYSFSLPAFIGSILGYLVTVNGSEVLKYIGATLIICLFRLIMHKRLSEKEHSFIGSVVTFCSVFLSGLIFLWFEEVSLLPFLILISESVIGLFASLIFIKAFNLPFYKGSSAIFTGKDFFALTVSVGITLMCLCSINIQQLSPGRIFTLVLLMFLCLFKGVGVSTAAGALTGAFLTFSPGGEKLFPAFVIASLVGGFLCEAGQTILSLAFTGAFFILSLFCCDLGEGWLSLIEPVIACSVFLLIPKLDSLLSNLNKITSNPSISSSLNNMEIITEDLKITTSKINRMLNNDISPLLTKTNNICQNLETTTSKFNNIDFVSLENNINTTMANVNSFTNRLNNENSSLGLLLNDASVYNNLDSTFRNASLLLEDLRMNPKRYVHFSIFGRK